MSTCPDPPHREGLLVPDPGHQKLPLRDISGTSRGRQIGNHQGTGKGNGYIDSVWNISNSYKSKLTSIWISASFSIGVNPWPIFRCLGGTCSQLTVTRMWRSGWWCSTWWGWSNQGAGHCLTTPTDWPKVRSTVLFIYWLHQNTWPCFILANHHDHCHWANFKLDKLLL